MATKRRRRNPRGEGTLLRAELLDAAEELLRKKGHQDRVSISEIVSKVGVTPPALYAHFPDKAELFREVHACAMSDFGEFIDKRVRRISPAIEQLRARGQAYLAYALAHPDAYRSLFMNPSSPDATSPDLPVLLLQDTAYSGLANNVARCRQEGSLPIQEDDVDQVARTLWALVHGVSSIALAMPLGFEPYGPENMLLHATNNYLRGVGATI